ncbi:MAG: hypothetical protein HRU06_17945 [Oceanospirillaceae bacterium]|nr:hypothetical protein [Oceanospirillaceae bacterium]
MNTTEKVTLKNTIVDTIIGYNENRQNETKQMHSKRVLEARRAIEKHNEKKQLSENLDDYYVLE